jgi:two-component system, LytTR family, response regulator
MIELFNNKNTFEGLGERSHRGIIAEEVVRILADVNYSEFYLVSGRKHVIAKTLKAYETGLQLPFVRVSKSCIVNMQYVTRTNRQLCQLELSDGSVVQVSRRRRHLLSK